MSVGALILAAGSSSRFGSPKQLVRIAGETLLDRSIRTAKEAGCSPVVAVLGSAEEVIRRECELRDVHLVSNERWREGMGASLACGATVFRGFSEIQGLIVMTCDMPAVQASHLRALASALELTASAYADRKGVPAYFPVELLPRLESLQGDKGAREMLQPARSLELPHGEVDIDEPQDLQRLRGVLSPQA